MPLANIAVQPRPKQQQVFDYSHYIDHLEIVQAINKKHGTHLPAYPIHPAPAEKNSAWKRLHQQFHIDMNTVLKTAGIDLTGPIDRVWYNHNFREHQQTRQMLGI